MRPWQLHVHFLVVFLVDLEVGKRPLKRISGFWLLTGFPSSGSFLRNRPRNSAYQPCRGEKGLRLGHILSWLRESEFLASSGLQRPHNEWRRCTCTSWFISSTQQHQRYSCQIVSEEIDTRQSARIPKYRRFGPQNDSKQFDCFTACLWAISQSVEDAGRSVAESHSTRPCHHRVRITLTKFYSTRTKPAQSVKKAEKLSNWFDRVNISQKK